MFLRYFYNIIICTVKFSLFLRKKSSCFLSHPLRRNDISFSLRNKSVYRPDGGLTFFKYRRNVGRLMPSFAISSRHVFSRTSHLRHTNRRENCARVARKKRINVARTRSRVLSALLNFYSGRAPFIFLWQAQAFS